VARVFGATKSRVPYRCASSQVAEGLWAGDVDGQFCFKPGIADLSGGAQRIEPETLFKVVVGQLRKPRGIAGSGHRTGEYNYRKYCCRQYQEAQVNAARLGWVEFA